MIMHKLFTAAIFGTTVLALPHLLEGRAPSVESNSTAGNIDLIHDLELAPPAADRINSLKALGDNQFVYDFLAPPSGATTTGLGGHTVKSDRKTFPALVETGVSMTLGFIGPCGFNTPHVHPRSSEINVIVEGRLYTELIAENGVGPVGPNLLEKFQMTAARTWSSIQMCDPAVFVAGFASEDPGVEQSAQTFFDFPPELVKAALAVQTLNGESISQFNATLPANVALGVESCLKKCGIAPQLENQPKGNVGTGT